MLVLPHVAAPVRGRISLGSGEGSGDDRLYPRSVVRNPCVDTKFASLSTPLAKGSDAINVPANTVINQITFNHISAYGNSEISLYSEMKLPHHLPWRWHNNGPPESPAQESTLPRLYPAQNMLDVM